MLMAGITRIAAEVSRGNRGLYFVPWSFNQGTHPALDGYKTLLRKVELCSGNLMINVNQYVPLLN